MNHLPQRGDLLLRGDPVTGFDVLDAITHQPIEGGLPTLLEAMAVARARGADTIWQQSFDNRGRPMGDPTRLALPPRT